MKFVLAHPATGTFIQQTARALFEADLLHRYWTTFVDQPGALWRKVVVGIADLVGADAERDLQRRAVTELPSDLVRSVPFWEIARTLLARSRFDPRLVDFVWERESLSFDRRVAANALDGADGMYGYEFSSLASFQEAKRRGLPRIYEVPAPEHEYIEGVIQRELNQFPELDTGIRRYFLDRQARRTTRRREEWALADIVIVSSQFTRQTYANAGLDTAKVRVVPLGAPPIDRSGLAEKIEKKGPLRVMWAGTFSVLKGAHYLLSAWRRFAPNKNATLEIFGANQLPASLTNNLPPSIKMSPTIPRSALFERFRAADVLVFPTLCDGFGMVVTEAFAHGLPVITTSRAGAADLVRHEENGLVIAPADSDALAGALEWCVTHRAQLQSMRQVALETAAHWQWLDFRRELTRNVIDGLRDAGYPA